MRIFLIGFMGSGKSYTGRRLAARIGRPFLDLDELIETRQQTTIAEIFARHGEDKFRRIESSILREMDQFSSAIIACGGGTPCYADNMDWMNSVGTTVFLDVDKNILIDRLTKASSHRPVLQTGQPIEQIVKEKLATRRKFYEKAHLHLRLDNPNPDLVRLIAEQLAALNGH